MAASRSRPGSGDALLLKRGEEPREDRLTDEREGDAEFEGIDDGPLACALLSGDIEDLLHQRCTVVVLEGEDLGRDIDQIGVELARSPAGEYLADLGRIHGQTGMHEVIGLGDELHVAVLDTVVDHLDEMPRPALADPVAAG